MAQGIVLEGYLTPKGWVRVAHLVCHYGTKGVHYPPVRCYAQLY